MRWLFLCLSAFVLASSFSSQTVYAQSSTLTHLLEGRASWYGPKFAGRKTANGEIFDPSQLTAAHKTLPFGSYVRVTNLSNNRTVTVRINDRGPFKPGRVIDLSRVAAEAIEMIGPGTARVQLELIDPYAEAAAAEPTPTGATVIESAGAETIILPAQLSKNFRVASELSLTGFNVISDQHPVGQLLLLEGQQGPIMVRVNSNLMPISSGVDIFVSPEALALLGDWVSISSN